MFWKLSQRTAGGWLAFTLARLGFRVIPVSIAYTTLLRRTKYQTWRPLWPGVHKPILTPGGAHNAFHGVDAGVNSLRMKWPFEPASNNEHGCAMHQRPDGEHQAGVKSGVSA